MVSRALLVFALTGALCTTTHAAEIEALGGRYDEAILGIDGKDGKLSVRTPKRALPLDSIKAIRFQALGRRAIRGSKVVLTTGDAVRGVVEGGSDEFLSVRSEALGSLKIPLELVRGVIPDGVTPERERRLRRELKQAAEIDSVRLKDGGIVKGTISEIDGSHVKIDTNVEGGPNMGDLRFALTKVELVSIAPLEDPPAAPEGLRTVVLLIDGTALTCALSGLADGRLTVKHPLGKNGSLTVPVSRVGEITVQNGLFVYLSDVEPAERKQHFPPEYTYEVEVWGFKRDRNVLGGKLRLGGRVYPKGLGVHSYCELTYRLDGGFAKFKTTIGLDDSTRYLGEPGFGAVVFRVLVDGKPAKELPSGVRIRKGDKPRELSIDLTGKQSLTLIADFDPTSLHVLGRANWADAHLIRKR